MKSANFFEKMRKMVGQTLLIAALAISAAACSNDDDPVNNDGTLSPDIPTAKFYKGADGLWYAEGRDMSQAEFNEKVVGNAWHMVEHRHINQDGTYGKDMTGITTGTGDIYFCFGKKEVTKYMYLDSDPFRCYAINTYEYGDPVGYLLFGLSDRIKPIGMIDDDHLEIIDCSAWTGPNKDLVPVYKVLEKVSPERLEQVKAECGSIDFAAWYQEQLDSLEGYDNF